jgi:hypothetical protein
MSQPHHKANSSVRSERSYINMGERFKKNGIGDSHRKEKNSAMLVLFFAIVSRKVLACRNPPIPERIKVLVHNVLELQK